MAKPSNKEDRISIQTVGSEPGSQIYDLIVTKLNNFPDPERSGTQWCTGVAGTVPFFAIYVEGKSKLWGYFKGGKDCPAGELESLPQDKITAIKGLLEIFSNSMEERLAELSACRMFHVDLEAISEMELADRMLNTLWASVVIWMMGEDSEIFNTLVNQQPHQY